MTRRNASARAGHAMGPIMRFFAPLFRRLAAPPFINWISYLPPLVFLEKAPPPLKVWPKPDFEVPEGLRTQPGIARHSEEETAIFEKEGPLPQWTKHYGALNDMMLVNLWRSLLPTAPRFIRGLRIIKKTSARAPNPKVSEMSPEDLTSSLKSFATDLDISAIGVTDMDMRYINADYQDRDLGNKVVVLVLERNFDAVQTSPSALFEQASIHTSGALMLRASKIARRLQDLGYKALPMPFDGGAIIHPFAVEAGLGQMGLNGQLLTPEAGCRASLCIIATDAPLVNDKPVDYGMEKLCDECRICVRRCPVNAIPAKRANYRGVEKAKLRTALCAPVVARADGCGICMKVCPAQRYGVKAMVEHYEKTGQILGKGSEELESYEWLDGKRYGAWEKPPLPDPQFFNVPGFEDSPAVARAEMAKMGPGVH